jgi:hypothetical protein
MTYADQIKTTIDGIEQSLRMAGFTAERHDLNSGIVLDIQCGEVPTGIYITFTKRAELKAALRTVYPNECIDAYLQSIDNFLNIIGRE